MIFFEDNEIVVMIDEEQLHLLVVRKLSSGEQITYIDMQYKSILKLSEHLRDVITLQLSLQILDDNNVPEDSNLRYLGRGWDWKPSAK